MAFYLTVMSVGTALIAFLNILFDVASPLYAIIGSVFATLLAFALDGLIAYLVHLIPNRLFPADSSRYMVSERAARLYERLGVKRWKDKVWELGGLGGFSKGAIASPDDPKYIEKFIIECNKGVLTHRIGYAAGFLAMLTLRMPLALTIALPVAVVNLFLNVLPTIVLRNNTPLLKSILHKLRARAEKQIKI